MNRVIFCCWTGNNLLSANRKKCLENMKFRNPNMIKLITPDNLNEYIIEPLHPAYEYLSLTHKADYLRCYLMHYHGGGYADIKCTRSWKNAFDDMDNNPNKLANGYRERKRDHVAGEEFVKDNYKRLIGYGSFIYRKNSEITTKWIKEMHRVLDSKLEQLRLNPAKSPTDCKLPYPIRWSEIGGEISSKILLPYSFQGKILFSVPYPDCTNYR